MEVNISGYEAVEAGIVAGGADRFVYNAAREPLRNAETAICRGSFFASERLNTVCAIYEKDAAVLRYAAHKSESFNAALEVIILGKEISSELLFMLQLFGIPVMAAENVHDIKRMVADGLTYSLLRKLPVAVFVPIRLLRSRQPVLIDGSFSCCDAYSMQPSERCKRISLIEEKYNRIFDASHISAISHLPHTPHIPDKPDALYSPRAHDCGTCDNRYLIITASGSADIISELVKKAQGISICRMDLFGHQEPRPASLDYRKVIILGHGSSYIKRIIIDNLGYYIDCTAIELSCDKLHEAQEIHNVLKRIIPMKKTFDLQR